MKAEKTKLVAICYDRDVKELLEYLNSNMRINMKIFYCSYLDNANYGAIKQDYIYQIGKDKKSLLQRLGVEEKNGCQLKIFVVANIKKWLPENKQMFKTKEMFKETWAYPITETIYFENDFKEIMNKYKIPFNEIHFGGLHYIEIMPLFADYNKSETEQIESLINYLLHDKETNLCLLLNNLGSIA